MSYSHLQTNPEHYLQLALDLAKKGEGFVLPNPMVGALIVKEGKIIGQGYHQKYGGPHAEVEAINSLESGVTAEGATLYCTLEPCCHTKKQTPPCVGAIIRQKFKKVYICTVDPNPAVSGKGIEELRRAGIEVEVGFLEKEASLLNEVFFKNMQTGRPFIHAKIAQTLDGRIATKSGDSKWVTSDECREYGHRLRAKYGAVAVGFKTLIMDNPQLNLRYGLDALFPHPKRIIFGSRNFKLSCKDSLLDKEKSKQQQVFQDQLKESTIYIAFPNEDQAFISWLKNQGVKVLEIKSKHLQQNEQQIIEEILCALLAEMKISAFLLEGGPQIITSFLRYQFIDQMSFFIAPKILGDGLNSVTDLNKKLMSEAILFHNDSSKLEILNNHLVFHGRPHYT